jgi:hypothetical protein
MTIVDTFSVTIGLTIILTLWGSIALEGLRRRATRKKKIIPTVNSKWQKKNCSINPFPFLCLDFSLKKE